MARAIYHAKPPDIRAGAAYLRRLPTPPKTGNNIQNIKQGGQIMKSAIDCGRFIITPNPGVNPHAQAFRCYTARAAE
jgi:hypothetical protein